MSSTYHDIYYANFPSLKGKLKQILCPECKHDYSSWGECEKCLRNRAYNQEYLQTHLFEHYNGVGDYHDGYHNSIKGCPLRLRTEHPRLFYGIEVEVEFEGFDVKYYDDYDDGYEPSEEIDSILVEFSRITKGLFVYEWDGSLDNGVEFISRPCSYAFWTKPSTVKLLKQGFEYLREHGAMVKQPSSNGMHIHISSAFFQHSEGDTSKMLQEYDWLFQYFQPELEILGGRKWTSYCKSKTMKLKERLRSDIMSIDGASVELATTAKLKKGGHLGDDHYSAVSNRGSTIETRVFNSTTDYKEILARIELVRSFAHAVRENNTGKSLNEILHTKDTLFLDEYIQKARMTAKKDKETLDLDKKVEEEIEVKAEG